MIEKTILDYLKRRGSVEPYMERPPKAPAKYWIVEKTGSGKSDKVPQASIVIQSYAPTLYEAALLNEEAKELMDQITDLDDVSSCSLNSDYNYTDTASKQPRYQAVFDVVHF